MRCANDKSQSKQPCLQLLELFGPETTYGTPQTRSWVYYHHTEASSLSLQTEWAAAFTTWDEIKRRTSAGAEHPRRWLMGGSVHVNCSSCFGVFLCKVAEPFKQVLSGIWSYPLKVSSAETVCTATHDITVGTTELAPRLQGREGGFSF